MKFAETLVLDFLEELIPEELPDEGVFEGLARSVRLGESVDVVRVEQIGRKTCDYVFGAGCWFRGTGTGTDTGRSSNSSSNRRGGRFVPDFWLLLRSRLGLWGGRPRVGLGHHKQSSKAGNGNKRRAVVVVGAKYLCGYTSSMRRAMG